MRKRKQFPFLHVVFAYTTQFTAALAVLVVRTTVKRAES